MTHLRTYPKINYRKFFSQYALYCSIFSPLHSKMYIYIYREQCGKHPTINPVTTENTKDAFVNMHLNH